MYCAVVTLNYSPLTGMPKFCTIHNMFSNKERVNEMQRVLDMPLRRCRPSEDVVPFSECRNNLSMYIGRVRETHRPVLITQNGRAASYLVDAMSMDELFDQIELSRDIEISRRELAEGGGIPNDEVFSRLHEKLLAKKAVRG